MELVLKAVILRLLSLAMDKSEIASKREIRRRGLENDATKIICDCKDVSCSHCMLGI
jgi:hypothetical protein